MFNKNLDPRWIKVKCFPEQTQLNPLTQIKGDKKLQTRKNMDHLQDFEKINATLRNIRETFNELNSNNLKTANGLINDCLNEIKERFKIKNPITKKITKNTSKQQLNTILKFGKILPNLKPTGRPKIKRSHRRLNPTPKKSPIKNSKRHNKSLSISPNSSNSLIGIPCQKKQKKIL